MVFMTDFEARMFVSVCQVSLLNLFAHMNMFILTSVVMKLLNTNFY